MLLNIGRLYFMVYLSTTFFSPSAKVVQPPNLKKAYSEHYQGSLLYAEGQVKRANAKFRQAYQILPDNFHFTLAYGLSEGRLGNASSAIKLMDQAKSQLQRHAPDYAYKSAITHFLKGMVYSYNQDYGPAHQLVTQALNQIPDTPAVQSIMLNTLGYLQIMNQSRNQHKGSKLEAHIHVRKHDLEAAHAYFSQALEMDSDNGAAFYNYKTLSDSLNLPLKFHKPTKGAKAKNQTGPTFLYMHRTISNTLELHKFSELAFLVDISGSMVAEKVLCMGDTRFAVMKDLSRKMVKEFPENMALGIGTIGGDCPDEPAKWKRTGSMTKKELDTDLRFLIPDGTTPMLTRLMNTPELFIDSLDTPKTLFLISDGANTCREAGLDVCAFAEKLARKGITINVLTFLNSSYNNTSAFSEYICLADVTGGRIIYMDNLRCNFEAFNFDLTTTCQLKIPILEKSYCWGKNIETLWMYSGE